MRANLESLAGRNFAHNASPEQILALRAKLTELAQPDIAEDRSTMLTVKNQFYDILIEGCGNLVAGQMLQQLNNRVTVLRRISMSQPGRFSNTLKELDAIVTAIEHRDGDTAARLCAEHVQKAVDNVLRSMQAS